MSSVKNCILVAGTAANQNPEFKITDTKLFSSLLTLLPVLTLSTQDNINLLKQLESGFKKQLIGTNICLKNQIKCKTDI